MFMMRCCSSCPRSFGVILFMFTENVLIGDCLFSFFPEEYPRHYCESIKICGKYLERNAGYLLKRRCKYNMACRQFLWCQASHAQTVRKMVIVIQNYFQLTQNIFIANLAAVLTVERIEETVKSLEEIAKQVFMNNNLASVICWKQKYQ